MGNQMKIPKELVLWSLKIYYLAVFILFLADEMDRIIEKVRNSTGPCICGKKCPSSDYQGIQPAVALTKKIFVSSKST